MPCLPDRVTEPKVFEFRQHVRLVQGCHFATVTTYQLAQLTFPTQRRNRQHNCWRLYPLRSGKACELGHKKTTQILLSAPLLCPCLQEFPSHNKFSPTTWAFGCSGGGEESGRSQANMWRNEMNDRLRLKEGNLKMRGGGSHHRAQTRTFISAYGTVSSSVPPLQGNITMNLHAMVGMATSALWQEN